MLEGLEKAERNVLPVLNNLLENREMQLEDGRFLMSAERYDKLLQVGKCHLDFLFLFSCAVMKGITVTNETHEIRPSVYMG